jgi:DNA-binding transcriptional regulator YhcF (GntR family)|tara:strand:- start:158 stop:1117 length:960 start_codon:yes stop_codon:yes gene_type:complete
MENVVNFKLPNKKKIIKKNTSLPDKRKFIVLPFSITSKKLTFSEYRVLIAIASYCNKAGLTWISQERLANELQVTRQFINKIYKQLKNKDIIERVTYHEKGIKGNTIRIIYNKEDTVEDIVATSSSKEEDTRPPEMKEKDRKEFINESPYVDLNSTIAKSPDEVDQLKKNRQYATQLKKVLKVNPNITKHGLGKVGENVNLNELKVLKTMIEDNMKKAKSKPNSVDKKEECKPDCKPNSVALTPQHNTNDNYSIEYIYNKYKITYGSETQITEEDVKATELLLNLGMNQKQFDTTLKSFKGKKVSLAEVLLKVSSKYSF